MKGGNRHGCSQAATLRSMINAPNYPTRCSLAPRLLFYPQFNPPATSPNIPAIADVRAVPEREGRPIAQSVTETVAGDRFCHTPVESGGNWLSGLSRT